MISLEISALTHFSSDRNPHCKKSKSCNNKRATRLKDKLKQLIFKITINLLVLLCNKNFCLQKSNSKHQLTFFFCFHMFTFLWLKVFDWSFPQVKGRQRTRRGGAASVTGSCSVSMRYLDGHLLWARITLSIWTLLLNLSGTHPLWTLIRSWPITWRNIPLVSWHSWKGLGQKIH